ncbi:hypothetical protein P8452_17136 [Trifolium repens]|nr:hypothetical protein P8452_17136 [Trifolium repens]
MRMWEQLESNGVVISKHQHGQQEVQVHMDLVRRASQLMVMKISIGHLDESSLYNCQYSTFALCGFTRAQKLYEKQD